MFRQFRPLALFTFIALALAACSGEPLTTAPVGLDPAAAELAAEAGRPIPDRYIVVFRDDVQNPNAQTDTLVRGTGATVHYRYAHAIKGFAATIPAAAVEGIRRNPNVAYVEQDSVVTAVATQSGATWGLDRIDQRSLPMDDSYTYGTTGAGVTAYIIDTGIRYAHQEFSERLSSGIYFDAFGGNGDDCNGHGTHVAGTVGGTTYGVAKGVSLVAVRVLDCNGSGTISGVVAGVDWVTDNANHPAVANMSLGGGASTTLDDAVAASIATDVVYAVAAGNGNRAGRAQDACGYSPARVPTAITVGATTSTDAKTSWSNYGDCVDWFAPGASITSAWHTSDTATNTISGTSMAAPHVAGAAALYLEGKTGATSLQVRDALHAMTTKGIVTSSSTANNDLLYTGTTDGGGGGDGGETNLLPTASFTYICADLTCDFDGSNSTDPELTPLSYMWTFGDGSTGDGAKVRHTYAEGDTYSVTLTVTDGSSGTDDETRTVTVSVAPVTGDFTLAVNGYKVKGVHTADLTWSGATSTSVDIVRTGTSSGTTSRPNDSEGTNTYTDDIGAKGGGSYTYKVCEIGTTTCSNEVTVNF